MDYETVVTITQSAALVFFVLLFVATAAYAFWPGNKRKFEKASRLPFDAGGRRINRERVDDGQTGNR